MFQFKQFTIRQNNCAMKVGTDGVLLGAWTNLDNVFNILDVGTGTGLIALMLAQRYRHAIIDALEIEKNAYKQAVENVKNSPWNNRIQVIHSSLQTFKSEKKYDVIVSNPPYFSHSLKNPNIFRTTARHNDSLSSSELIIHAKKLLKSDGKLAVIFPATEALLLQKQAIDEGFHISKLTKVIPKTNAETKRLLMEFSLLPTTYIENEIVIEKGERHNYSDDYKKLTKDFYLNF